MSDGQNTELAALAAQANMLDAELTATGPEAIIAEQEAAQVVEQESGNTREVRMILAMAVPLLGQLFPSIADIYTDPTCDQVATVLGPVLTKYNINLGDMSSKWGPEIAAAVVCGPLAVATYKGIQFDLAARNPQVPKAVASNSQPAPSAPAEVVTLG